MSETRTYAVCFEVGTEQLSLTPLGSERYRVEESSLANDSINLGDVIAGSQIDEGKIKFLNVVQKSSYVTLRWIISKSAAESDGLTRFLKQVNGVGGLWERVLGGVLILHLPHETAFDAAREFKLQTNVSS
jgi:Domain of unknown function (DUF4265)